MSAYDPGQETEGQATATLTKQWFRLKVIVGVTGGGSGPSVSCWAGGFLEMRTS